MIDCVCRGVPDAMLDKAQVASALSIGYSDCFANSMILGTRLASMTIWIGGYLSAEISFLIPMIP